MTLFESALLGLVLGAVVVKPQELPGLGRRAGRLAGRAVRRLQDMKKELGEYVEKNDMRSVQDELQQTMAQLNRIRHDVKSVSSVRGMMMDFTTHPTPRDEACDASPVVDSTRMKVPDDGRIVHTRVEGVGEDGQQHVVIPISARDLEDLEKESSPAKYSGKQSRLAYQEDENSASRVLLDALKEERVAQHALQFFDSKQQSKMPDKD